MALTLVDDSDAVEPITLSEAKLQLKLPVGEVHPEDALIRDVLIPAVRERCETVTGLSLRVLTYDWGTRPGDEGLIELPKPPLLEVLSIGYLDLSEDAQVFDDDNYVVTAPTGGKVSPGWIRLKASALWPTVADLPDAMTIRFRCGYGSRGLNRVPNGPVVPPLLKVGMLLDLATLYLERENVTENWKTIELPGGRRSIYWMFRNHPIARAS